MPGLAERARAYNRTAAYLAPDPGDADAIPVIVLAGMRIGTYITDEGALFIGCVPEEAASDCDHKPVAIRPIRQFRFDVRGRLRVN